MDDKDIAATRSEFNLMTGKNKWIVKYKDGSTDEKELPVFIDRCDLCGDAWINKKEDNGCPLHASSCCGSCAKKCKENGVCGLK